jgi:hypothetical protein
MHHNTLRNQQPQSQIQVWSQRLHMQLTANNGHHQLLFRLLTWLVVVCDILLLLHLLIMLLLMHSRRGKSNERKLRRVSPLLAKNWQAKKPHQLPQSQIQVWSQRLHMQLTANNGHHQLLFRLLTWLVVVCDLQLSQSQMQVWSRHLPREPPRQEKVLSHGCCRTSTNPSRFVHVSKPNRRVK